ncbi:hypothetical protein [Nonomuraea endophytica]|uniref:hypothetical protein n=1 Tax=Nonomuraea endophytica TaxID=714136 RepID=UPI0037CB5D4E
MKCVRYQEGRPAWLRRVAVRPSAGPHPWHPLERPGISTGEPGAYRPKFQAIADAHQCGTDAFALVDLLALLLTQAPIWFSGSPGLRELATKTLPLPAVSRPTAPL